jgi:hypothetical protein
MSEWKQYKLSDFMDFNPSTSLNKDIGDIAQAVEDKQPAAIELVMKQAENLADIWAMPC